LSVKSNLAVSRKVIPVIPVIHIILETYLFHINPPLR
jgi:hypothetical protein